MGKHGKPLKVATYMTEVRPGHPVAHADGRVRIHRANLYDKIGPGPHPCHWCGLLVDWYAEPQLVADHLDGDTWNNDAANMVPSCLSCNMQRAPRPPRKPIEECRRGHPFTPENTYHRPDGGGRQCRECNRRRVRERDARRRQERAA